MTEITTFKCRACDGTGGSGPFRKSTGLPWRPCIQCSGIGEIEREVEDVFDRQGRMSAVALLHQEGGRTDARTLKVKGEIEARRFEKEWTDTRDGLDRASASDRGEELPKQEG